MGVFANNEDTDDMWHDAAFHQGLHSLLRQNLSSEKEIQYFQILKIITGDPSICIMDHPDFINCIKLYGKFTFGLKWVKAPIR